MGATRLRIDDDALAGFFRHLTCMCALHGVYDFDDSATLAANIHKLRVSEGFVLNHPRPVNPRGTTSTNEFDFHFFDAGAHPHFTLLNDSSILWPEKPSIPFRQGED